MNKALAYSMAYLLTYSFSIIISVMTLAGVENVGPTLNILAHIFFPLQGFFNFLVFIYPRVMDFKRAKRRNGDEGISWYRAFVKAICSRGTRGRGATGTALLPDEDPTTRCCSRWLLFLRWILFSIMIISQMAPFFMLFGYDNIVTICLFMLSVIAKGSLAVAYSRCCKDDLPRTRMCLIVSTGSLFLMWVVSIFGQLEDVAYAMVDFLGMGYCVEKAWYRYNDGRSSGEGR